MLKERSNEIIVPSPLTGGSEMIKVDALALPHRELNAKLRGLISNGAQRIELHNIYGQRYIGTDLDKPVEIEIMAMPKMAVEIL